MRLGFSHHSDSSSRKGVPRLAPRLLQRRLAGDAQRSAPRHIDEQAARRTDGLLARLADREWSVLDEIDPRHGVDHVLVGPGGVFLVASRKPEGPGVRVRDGVLWLRRGADTRSDRPGVAINRQVLDSARALQREIRSRTGRGPKIHPVVVLWCEFPQAVVEARQITFVHARDLLWWLSARPPQLDEGGRLEVVEAIKAIPHERGWRAARVRLRHRAA